MKITLQVTTYREIEIIFILNNLSSYKPYKSKACLFLIPLKCPLKVVFAILFAEISEIVRSTSSMEKLTINFPMAIINLELTVKWSLWTPHSLTLVNGENRKSNTLNRYKALSPLTVHISEAIILRKLMYSFH